MTDLSFHPSVGWATGRASGLQKILLQQLPRVCFIATPASPSISPGPLHGYPSQLQASLPFGQ